MTTITAFIVLCGALFVNGAFLRRPQLDGRIIGGTDADIVDHPYQVSFRSEGNDYPFCSATIISENWVLTAARCVVYSSISSMLFRAGSSRSDRYGSLHIAEKYAVHMNYYNGERDYDYALVMVYPPFSFGPSVQPISLADYDPEPGEEATITGWGLDDLGGSDFKDRLQVANVLISDPTTCDNTTPRLICARPGEDGKDMCYGDNGGPLVVGGNLAGIASIDGCGSTDYPSIYASVANQREWIRDITGI